MTDLEKHLCCSSEILLKSLFQVYEQGSFEEASKELHMQPNTIYKHVIKLEKRIGEKLFIRRKSPFQLTEAGKELLLTLPAFNDQGYVSQNVK